MALTKWVAAAISYASVFIVGFGIYFVLAPIIPIAIPEANAMVLLPNMMTVEGVLIGLVAAMFGAILSRGISNVMSLRYLVVVFVGTEIMFLASLGYTMVELVLVGANGLSGFDFVIDVIVLAMGTLLLFIGIGLYAGFVFPNEVRAHEANHA